MPQPLPLPDNFNPATQMLSKTTEYGVFHETRQAARLAERLVANGDDEDLRRAEPILHAVLQCQEVDPRDPHCGNFYWMREDQVVEDLNAVEFVLEALIPLMRLHGHRLSPSMRTRTLDAIRLGLAEIARLDVLVAYTNITALDILNTIVGGELLGAQPIAQRGYAKLVDWIEFTNQSGHPWEYNSPTYSAVTLRALKRLTDLSHHEPTRQRAEMMIARLALSYALHIHSGTGRLAGPHGRAYQPSLVGETAPEVATLRTWIAAGVVPDWLADVLSERPPAFQIDETAARERAVMISTYQTPAYALGVASRSLHPQANNCLVHYVRPGSERPGVLYTRYLLNDKWFGDDYHATDRTKSRNLLDEGDFLGVLDENRALGVYTCTNLRQGHSAKAALVWTARDQIDEIWVNGELVEMLPCTVPPAAVIVVGSGDVYCAVRPLTLTPLGRTTPVQLVERAGDLVLELYNYQGPNKRFWELNWPGAFFQGWPVCAFYLEIDERTGYLDGAAFGRRVASGQFTDDLAASFTYRAAGERLYTAAYRRDELELGLMLDVMQWQLLRRWTRHGDPDWPMLASPLAVQSRHGTATVGGAEITATHGPVWLCALPSRRYWIGGYSGLESTSFKLTTPEGEVLVDQMGMGAVRWEAGKVTCHAVGNPHPVIRTPP